MNNEIDGWYEAYKAKDKRFDGKFFVGIKSTNIYCRPICTARLASQKNTIFFENAAQAEKSGFRPCLKCRPELIINNNSEEYENELLKDAISYINNNFTSSITLDDISYNIGCSKRHLSRVFKEELNITCKDYIKTKRLLLSKQLIVDSNLRMIDIAYAVGFGSLKTFNTTFKQQYNLSPSQLRINKNIKYNDDSFMIHLNYQRPYNWEDILSFLSSRTIEGVEKVENNKYYRSVVVKNDNKKIFGWLEVSNNKKRAQLDIRLSSTLIEVLPFVISRLKVLFDLDAQPDIINETLIKLNDKFPSIHKEGVRIPGTFDPFEMIVRAIVGQQISVKGARTIIGRLIKTYGYKVETPFKDIDYAFCLASDIIALEDNIEEHLGLLGIIKRRSNTILALAHAYEDKTINFFNPSNPEEEIKKLVELPGIGIWTAHYIALRAMNYTDAFLHTDLGVLKAYAPLKPKEILKEVSAYSPWRGYAMINLWLYEAKKEK